MSCIIALKYFGEIWMGADSAITSNDDDIMSRKQSKIFYKDIPLTFEQLNDGENIHTMDSMIIGYSGWPRSIQIIQHIMINPVHPFKMPTEKYLVELWIPEVQKQLKIHGTLVIKEGCHYLPGAELLIGYQNKIFYMPDDFQLIEFSCVYKAIGTGTKYAMGAIYSLQDNMDRLGPKRMIESALNAACAFSKSVQEPYHILSLPCDNNSTPNTQNSKL